jgi:hypothetical protein
MSRGWGEQRLFDGEYIFWMRRWQMWGGGLCAFRKKNEKEAAPLPKNRMPFYLCSKWTIDNGNWERNFFVKTL